MIETKVTWRGEESIAAIEEALRGCGRAEVRLPAEYHHALWRGLGKAAPGSPELLDVEGGRDLLARIARIEGLAGLGQLATVLAGEVEIRVVSPNPLVLLDVRRAGPSGCAADG